MCLERRYESQETFPLINPLQMMERYMDPDYLASQGPFVAAFASTNLGDISPNILVSISTT
jgi:hypothetical protein